jgi:hypothetical protein
MDWPWFLLVATTSVWLSDLMILALS